MIISNLCGRCYLVLLCLFLIQHLFHTSLQLLGGSTHLDTANIVARIAWGGRYAHSRYDWSKMKAVCD